MIDKRVRDLVEAVAGIPDGAVILCAGFGGAGLPDALCEAVIEQGARDLTVVANNAGTGRTGLAALLAAARVRRIICSFPRSSGSVVFEELYAAGRIELELAPQSDPNATKPDRHGRQLNPRHTVRSCAAFFLISQALIVLCSSNL